MLGQAILQRKRILSCVPVHAACCRRDLPRPTVGFRIVGRPLYLDGKLHPGGKGTNTVDYQASQSDALTIPVQGDSSLYSVCLASFVIDIKQTWLIWE